MSIEHCDWHACAHCDGSFDRLAAELDAMTARYSAQVACVNETRALLIDAVIAKNEACDLADIRGGKTLTEVARIAELRKVGTR